ncbi:PREDICTED: GDSL esterase/lipase At5g55050 [Tarenaya hassleriana]|uniref:GDSL esterase/lipase At5g55050 n=1 Tax=Tarenaya hassleriana TaxID=28532 RepID=UPI00053C4EAE|nr:PREDICTED: GDSL esterase/lipase At5g55050 [Tarenaya hassleriana]
MPEINILVAVFFVMSGLAVAGEPVKGLYVFGDSLVDVGNNNYLPVSLAKANYPHNGIDFPTKKPTGRFCNGKNAADVIAEKLGIPSPPPYLSLKKRGNESGELAGVNFASGGAGIFNGSDQTLGQSIPLSQQVNNYISVHEELVKQLSPSAAQNHLSKSIFVIVIGSNDLFDYFSSFKLRQKNNPQQYTQMMATKLKEQLKRIYDNGGRKFVVIGIGQIGCIPVQRKKNSTYECNREPNMWCSVYNQALRLMLQQFAQDLHGSMRYSYVDNFIAMQDIISNPTVYGFKNVEAACCGRGKLNAELPCLPIAKYCSDRTAYFFWDLYGHPTEAAARKFVETVDLSLLLSSSLSPRRNSISIVFVFVGIYIFVLQK